jgi:hypothetical protein
MKIVLKENYKLLFFLILLLFRDEHTVKIRSFDFTRKVQMNNNKKGVVEIERKL